MAGLQQDEEKQKWGLISACKSSVPEHFGALQLLWLFALEQGLSEGDIKKYDVWVGRAN